MTETPESPAATIRRAAASMKAGAEAATEGPWRAVAGIWDGRPYPAVIKAHGDPEDPGTWLMATGGGGADSEADAAWAASMHPLVGAALAEWLAAAADAWTEGMCWDEALNVACCYLGETR